MRMRRVMSFLSQKGLSVCVRERACVFSQSIDSFFTEFEKIKPRFEIIGNTRERLLINPSPPVCESRLFTVCKDL